MSSDPEWRYVNVRRLFIFIEHSIDRGTQWVVFEPNNQATWQNVTSTIEAFLLDVFKSGALLGAKPEEAFFVRCDRTTMTQNDLDNGRLICLIGVAPAFPAEFVIFRIGQFTADAKGG
jgi:phage tail sheath protein FI